MCVCVCVYVCVCVCARARARVCIYKYVIYMCVCVCVYVCMYACLYLLGVDSENFSFLSAFAKLRKATISLVMSVCRSPVHVSAWNNSATTGQIFITFDIYVFLENLSKKLKFH
jgi:hypothetical protein